MEALSFAELASALSSYGGGDLSADLALDLVLNEIVEQARLATNATAAAIALTRDGEIVCRATTGANAPDLGVRLDSKSGLSGACVQSKHWQRCDDTASDIRVDSDACKRLGVRAILVFPVLKEEKLLGVIEVFSSVAHAFTDREIQTLDALSRSIIGNIDRAAEVQPLALPQETPAPATASEDSSEAVLAVEPAILTPPPRSRDYATSALTAAVVLLALTLGWVVGRVGTQNVFRASAQSPRLKPQPAAIPAAPGSNTAMAPGSVSPSTASGASQMAAPDPAVAPPPREKPAAHAPDNGLVVYEKGKVIYQMAQPSSPPASPRPGATAEGQSPQLSSQTAAAYLLQRVEPQYPETARAQHIQGPVVLRALVGKNGSVEQVETLSGDPQLAAAATEAVRQWRFKPLLRNGSPEDFQTQITVSFRLPETASPAPTP